jgi:hypothetical protein
MRIELDPREAASGLLSELRAARYLGVAAQTLRNYREKGSIAAERGVGARLYSLADLDRFGKKHLPAVRRNASRAGWGRTRRAATASAANQLREDS